jgi:cold shock CspA family protein/ribosome-associated translation inhibitor RaiA
VETAVQIDYQGGPIPQHMHDAVASHVAALERRFGRITACRVAIKPPTGHHRTGGPYTVSIHLALPNKREVTVDRASSADERFADATFAINDAFKRARRQLQSQVRRMRGDVKVHAEQPIGQVALLDGIGGFGFINSADGREIYFHRNSVLGEGFGALRVGTKVSFAEEKGEKGPQASTVRIAGKHGLR